MLICNFSVLFLFHFFCIYLSLDVNNNFWNITPHPVRPVKRGMTTIYILYKRPIAMLPTMSSKILIKTQFKVVLEGLALKPKTGRSTFCIFSKQASKISYNHHQWSFIMYYNRINSLAFLIAFPFNVDKNWIILLILTIQHSTLLKGTYGFKQCINKLTSARDSKNLQLLWCRCARSIQENTIQMFSLIRSENFLSMVFNIYHALVEGHGAMVPWSLLKRLVDGHYWMPHRQCLVQRLQERDAKAHGQWCLASSPWRSSSSSWTVNQWRGIRHQTPFK